MVSIFSKSIWLARSSSRVEPAMENPNETPAKRATATTPKIAMATNASTNVAPLFFDFFDVSFILFHPEAEVKIVHFSFGLLSNS